MFSPTARRAISASLLRQAPPPSPTSRIDKLILAVRPELDFSDYLPQQPAQAEAAREWISGQRKSPPGTGRSVIALGRSGPQDRLARSGGYKSDGPARSDKERAPRGSRPDYRDGNGQTRTPGSLYSANGKSGAVLRTNVNQAGRQSGSDPARNMEAARFNPSSPDFIAPPVNKGERSDRRDQGPSAKRGDRPPRREPRSSGPREPASEELQNRKARSTIESVASAVAPSGASSRPNDKRTTKRDTSATNSTRNPSTRDRAPTSNPSSPSQPSSTYVTSESRNLDQVRYKKPTTMDLFGFEEQEEVTSGSDVVEAGMVGGEEVGSGEKDVRKGAELSRRDRKAVTNLEKTIRSSGDFSPYIPTPPSDGTSSGSAPSTSAKDLSAFLHVQARLSAPSPAGTPGDTSTQLTLAPPSVLAPGSQPISPTSSPSTPKQIRQMAAFHADWTLARNGATGGIGRKERLAVVGEMRRRLGLTAA